MKKTTLLLDNLNLTLENCELDIKHRHFNKKLTTFQTDLDIIEKNTTCELNNIQKPTKKIKIWVSKNVNIKLTVKNCQIKLGSHLLLNNLDIESINSDIMIKDSKIELLNILDEKSLYTFKDNKINNAEYDLSKSSYDSRNNKINYLKVNDNNTELLIFHGGEKINKITFNTELSSVAIKNSQINGRLKVNSKNFQILNSVVNHLSTSGTKTISCRHTIIKHQED